MNQSSYASTSILADSHPASPVRSEATVTDEENAANTFDMNGFVKENGLTNRAYHGSTSILSIPMQKSTSTMYLPRDPTFLPTAKQREYLKQSVMLW